MLYAEPSQEGTAQDHHNHLCVSSHSQRYNLTEKSFYNSNTIQKEINLPVSHFTPVYPVPQWQVNELTPSTQVPLLTHGVVWHSSISVIKGYNLFGHFHDISNRTSVKQLNSNHSKKIVMCITMTKLDNRNSTHEDRETSGNKLVEEASRSQHTRVGIDQGTFNRHTMSFLE